MIEVPPWPRFPLAWHLFPGSEDEAATLLDGYLAREVGASTVAQTVAHPEETLI